MTELELLVEAKKLHDQRAAIDNRLKEIDAELKSRILAAEKQQSSE